MKYTITSEDTGFKYIQVLPGNAIHIRLSSPDEADSVRLYYAVAYDCRPENTTFSPFIRCGEHKELEANALTILWIPGVYRFEFEPTLEPSAVIDYSDPIPHEIYDATVDVCGLSSGGGTGPVETGGVFDIFYTCNTGGGSGIQNVGFVIPASASSGDYSLYIAPSFDPNDRLLLTRVRHQAGVPSTYLVPGPFMNDVNFSIENDTNGTEEFFILAGDCGGV